MVNGRLTLAEVAELFELDEGAALRLAERHGWRARVSEVDGARLVTFGTEDVLRDYHAIRNQTAASCDSPKLETSSRPDGRVLSFPKPAAAAPVPARPVWIDHLERIAEDMKVSHRMAAEAQREAIWRVLATAALIVLFGFALLAATAGTLFLRWERTEREQLAARERIAVLEARASRESPAFSLAPVREE